MSLGDEVAGNLFRLFNEDEIELLGKEISKLDTVTPEQAEKVLQEFHELSVARGYIMSGGITYAKRVLNSAFGPERARSIIDRLVK